MDNEKDKNEMDLEECIKQLKKVQAVKTTVVRHEPQETTAVPFFVYETEVARNERTTKRLIIALVIAIILIFASNAAWLYAWTRYDYTSEEVNYSQDGEGINNINTGEQGDINNGPDVTGQAHNISAAI